MSFLPISRSVRDTCHDGRRQERRDVDVRGGHGCGGRGVALVSAYRTNKAPQGAYARRVQVILRLRPRREPHLLRFSLPLLCYTSASTSMSKVLRVPKLDLSAVLAQQNPQIDLRLEAYEASTRNFLKAVSNYTQRAVTEITNRKNAFATEKKKIAEKTTQIETETNQSKLKEIELIAGAFQTLYAPALVVRGHARRVATHSGCHF